MPSAEQLRSRLLKKLSELFQLDQPDLDFGFYRIMHAKAQEVQDFIGSDLLKIVADAFGDADEARKVELQAAYEKAIQTAKEFGVSNPEETEPVKKAKAALDAVKDTASAEADVYDHLYRFFERYYDDGDFISRRYYTRETSGKAAPFAVPYNGEDVKLHWANADQYYIKSAEYFSNFTFDLRQAQEFRALRQQNQIGILLGVEDDSPIKVHFRVVEAAEGEHGNVKPSEANKRFFILHAENSLALTESGELVVNFEYRPDPEKNGQENTWRDKRNAEAVETILERLKAMVATGGEHEKQVAEYLRLFKIPAPTDSDKKRPVLAKYVNQYTARNTMDYFIHKDLGGFLRRELDFYIKNEVMRLDDIENAEAPAVESYLAKLKVLRKIAGKLIDFLAQLEDFQKKLWLKKKFIIETNYCITLDRVPEELFAEVATCDAQCEEWIKLFAIDEIRADLHNPGFSRPLTVEFLKANKKLVLDTRFFEDSFKARLVASIKNFDEQCDGLLINADNFQSALLLHPRYRATINGVYLDPPYNTDASEIIYKNGYKNSSWASLMYDRLSLIKSFQKSDGGICVTIDDFEKNILKDQLDNIYGSENDLATVAIRSNPQGRSTVQGFSINHEYALFYKASSDFKSVGRLTRSDKQIGRYNEVDEEGKGFLWENFRKTGTDSSRIDRPKQFYPIVVKRKDYRIPEMEWDDVTKVWNLLEETTQDETVVYPVDEDGNERVWKWGHDRVKAYPDHIKVENGKNDQVQIYRRNYLNNEGSLPGTWWDKGKYGAGSHGTNLLTAMFGKGHAFSFPKSIYAVEDCLRIVTNNNRLANVLDFFGGSGTTAHALISMNRSDKGKRKYLLTEMGLHFDEILLPRIKKAVYSASWDGGKPQKFSNFLSGLKKRLKDLNSELENLSGYQDQNEYQFDRQLIVGEIAKTETEIQLTEEIPAQDLSCFIGNSHTVKYIRLESYEDTLNNLRLDHNPKRKKAVAANPALKEDYMLRYLLDVETRGSQSLLNIDAFADPTAYTLDVKKPGTDEYATRAVDLIETFNYLIGLRVLHSSVPQTFQATFKRITDPELPEDQHTKLVVDGRIRQDEGGQWWFRKVEGWVPKDPANPNNGQRENVLVVWRKLTDDIEQDNLMLDEWFQKNRISARDFEFDTIYVNGSNNLPNLNLDDENWKVRLIEEEFMKRMWNGENA
jgi:adenine-specific DNA-methyltransferase